MYKRSPSDLLVQSVPLSALPVEAGRPGVQLEQTPAADEMHHPQNATFLLQLFKKSRQYTDYINQENRYIEVLKDLSILLW